MAQTREQQRAMFAKRFGTTGSKKDNPVKALNQFEESFDFVREHIAGKVPQSLRSGNFRELNRQEAVKMANIIKKKTGEFPVDYEELKMYPKDFSTEAGSPPEKEERKKPIRIKFKLGDDIDKFVSDKWRNNTSSSALFWVPQVKSVAKQLSGEQRIKFLNMSQPMQTQVIAKLANLPSTKFRISAT